MSELAETIAEAIEAEVSEQVEAQESETVEALTETVETLTETVETLAETIADQSEPEPEPEAEAPILTILNRQTELLAEIKTLLTVEVAQIEPDDDEVSDLEAPLEIVLPIEMEAEPEPEPQRDWLTNLLFG